MNVFISYAYEDSGFAKHLAEEVERMGFHVFIGEQEIEVGGSIPQAIGKAINDCNYFIIILSPSAVQSVWVKRELDIAIMIKEIKIVPVLYKECDIPPMLTPILHINITRDAEEKAIENIMEKLMYQMSKSKSKPTHSKSENTKRFVEHKAEDREDNPTSKKPQMKHNRSINIKAKQITGDTINIATEINIINPIEKYNK